MDVNREKLAAQGIRFSVSVNGAEVARAYLYLMHNDLHQEPFGLVEDVFVDEAQAIGILGERHFVEDDKMRTHSGTEMYSAVETETGKAVDRIHDEGLFQVQ